MDTIYLDICEAGKRFFWCVTENSDAYPLAHDHCDTFEEAEEKMWAIGTILAKGRETRIVSWKIESGKKNFPDTVVAIWQGLRNVPCGYEKIQDRQVSISTAKACAKQEKE